MSGQKTIYHQVSSVVPPLSTQLKKRFFEDSLKGTTQVSIKDTITHLSSCQTNKLQKGLTLRHQLNAAGIRS